MRYDPNEVYLVADNVEAMRLMSGVLHLMKPKAGCNETHHCFETDTHWCQGSHFVGHPEEKDNGYSVTMVPKSKMTRDSAAIFFEDIRRGNREEGYAHLSYAEFHPIPKATNN